MSGKNKVNAFKQWKDGVDLPANLISAKNKISILTFDVI